MAYHEDWCSVFNTYGSKGCSCDGIGTFNKDKHPKKMPSAYRLNYMLKQIRRAAK